MVGTNVSINPGIILVDFTDFAENNDKLFMLYRIKKAIPNFKATLFTVLGRCSQEFFNTVKALDWLDIAHHGWLHSPDIPLSSIKWTACKAREFEYWEEKDYLDYLEKTKDLNISKIIKPPGWRMSAIGYQIFTENGFVIADIYTNSRLWGSAQIYIYPITGQEKKRNIVKWSCHIQNIWRNEGIEKRWQELLPFKNYEFKFIKEYIS